MSGARHTFSVFAPLFGPLGSQASSAVQPSQIQFFHTKFFSYIPDSGEG